MKPDEQRELIAMAQAGCIESRNRLIEDLIPWIKSRCNRRGQFLHAFDDVFQSVIVAMIRAIETFDLSLDVQPMTYFRNRIRGAVADYWRNQLPPGGRRGGNAAFGVVTIPTADFQEMVHPVDEIPELRRADFEAADLVEQLANSLSQPDSDIVRWRFLRDMTHAEIAKRIGVCESRISQRLRDLMPLLRSRLESHLKDGRPMIARPIR